MSQDARLSLAAEYARLLILAKEASRKGLDQSAEVRSLEKFSRLQVLASELVKRTTANAPQVPVDEIEHYFHKHVRDYREVALSRVTLPATPLSDQHSRATASARAAEIQKKAASGEQFSKLQQEVAGSSSEPPSSIVGVILCSSLPEAHRVVCELQPGTVSEVIADKFGYYIYRLDSARDRTLDEVRDEIRAKLQRDRLQSEIEKMRSPISLDLDESYFGKLPSEDVAHQHGMHFPRAKTVRVNDTTATPHPHRH